MTDKLQYQHDFEPYQKFSGIQKQKEIVHKRQKLKQRFEEFEANEKVTELNKMGKILNNLGLKDNYCSIMQKKSLSPVNKMRSFKNLDEQTATVKRLYSPPVYGSRPSKCSLLPIRSPKHSGKPQKISTENINVKSKTSVKCEVFGGFTERQLPDLSTDSNNESQQGIIDFGNEKSDEDEIVSQRKKFAYDISKALKRVKRQRKQTMPELGRLKFKHDKLKMSPPKESPRILTDRSKKLLLLKLKNKLRRRENN